ncbi:MAG: glycosyltransferase [Candidatus Micrarchaeaceae archaeon]|jgi:1,2-diacylglycerol 3-alpha-glucosyltransferase
MTESLNIAFYTDTFLPAVDGVVISILNAKKELEKRGHHVYIFASGTEKTKEMVKNDKSIVVVPGIKFKKYPQYSLALFPMASTLKLRNVKMDINHAHTPFMLGIHSLMLSRIDRKPIVGSFHTLFTDSSVIKEYVSDSEFLRKTLISYSWKYAELFYNRCDSVIAPSTAIQQMLVKKSIRNVSVIPNGVDTKKFNPKINGDRIRKKLVKNDKEKLVMYVGRLSREKNIDTLIKAAQILKKENIRFALVGSGPAHSYYEKMVHKMHLNDRVKFVGFIDNMELPKYYAACDAFCIPSTFETQGVVSLEAMASGKPVIGADYLALKELIKNGKNGEKFKPRNSKDCADKIKKVIYNIDSYKEMADTAKTYSIERTTTDLLDLYKGLIK